MTRQFLAFLALLSGLGALNAPAAAHGPDHASDSSARDLCAGLVALCEERAGPVLHEAVLLAAQPRLPEAAQARIEPALDVPHRACPVRMGIERAYE